MNRVSHPAFLGSVLIAVILAGGVTCREEDRRLKPAAGEKIAARVNDSVLLEKDVDSAVADFFGGLSADGKKREYIEQWVESELLYQKALEEGLQEDKEIQKKVDRFRHVLLEQEVLKKYLDDEVVVTDDEIQAYYGANRAIFMRNEDEYRVKKISFNGKGVAKEVYGELSVAPERLDDLLSSGQYDHSVTAADIGFYPTDQLEGTFTDGLKVGAMSPLTEMSPGNYYALLIVEYGRKGSEKGLDEVEDQIRNVLLQSKGENAREMLIEELKKKADIEIAGDTVD